MERNSQQQVLYEILRIYRNSIFTSYDSYYTNAELDKLVDHQPCTEDEFLKILPSEERFRQYGVKFLGLIRVFNPSDQGESIEAKADQIVKDLEVDLHAKVVRHLRDEFDDGDDWWYKGIPEKIRVNAAKMHEESGGSRRKEKCLYLIDLKEIILEHWSDFQEGLDPENKGKREFERRFNGLNDIRNRLGHPTRLQDEPIKPEELEILTSWHERVKSLHPST